MKYSLTLITGNENKFREIKNFLSNYNIELEKIDLDINEIQSENLEEIILDFIQKAYKMLKKPVIAEDSGLFIRSLKGFPGPYSSYVYKTLGNEGILKLMEGIDDRYAEFKCALAYKDEENEKVFLGISAGYISEKIKGKGWGFDPIFIPKGSNITFGEMNIEEKNKYSHRGKSLSLFVNWFSENYLKKSS
jgi:non-canonical purine NTP pyrophosphatase, rdgB/HAM1 family